MADIPQLPAPNTDDSPDDGDFSGTGFYQVLVLFVIFAVLMGLIVVGSQAGA